MEKVYSNMSACHIKRGNWKRALESADQAIATNENNLKALFRKGKALGELGYFEKAEKVLKELAEKNPEGPLFYNNNKNVLLDFYGFLFRRAYD
jgi:tetratricopeptide (TPR) repeat protein